MVQQIFSMCKFLDLISSTEGKNKYVSVCHWAGEQLSGRVLSKTPGLNLSTTKKERLINHAEKWGRMLKEHVSLTKQIKEQCAYGKVRTLRGIFGMA